MAKLGISLFGPFQVLLNSWPVTQFESVKVRTLLAYLAVLFILLPCVPVVILQAIPDVVGISHLVGWLISMPEIAWVLKD